MIGCGGISLDISNLRRIDDREEGSDDPDGRGLLESSIKIIGWGRISSDIFNLERLDDAVGSGVLEVDIETVDWRVFLMKTSSAIFNLRRLPF